jgi:hypothetical protein
MEETMYHHDGYFSAQGYCPNCKHKISLRLKIGFAGGRAHAIDPEVIKKVIELSKTKRAIEIARELNIPYSRVQNIKARFNLSFPALYAYLYPEIDALLSSMRNKDIAQKFGVSISLVSRRRLVTGVGVDFDILPSQKKEKVLKLHNDGFSFADIGRAMRLSRQRVEQIVKEVLPGTIIEPTAKEKGGA